MASFSYSELEGFKTTYEGMSKSWTRLNKCSCWFSTPVSVVNEVTGEVRTLIFIRSYNTIVGIYDCEDKVYYMLGVWSRTTSQHNWKMYRKFAKTDDALLVKFDKKFYVEGYY